MRIGIDARFFGAKKNRGLGRYTEQLINNLIIVDRDSDYVIFLNSDNYNELKNLPNSWQKVKVDILWYSFREQLTWPGILKKYNLDLMHFAHFNVPFFYNGKFVVTIHDLIMTHYQEDRSTTKSKFVYNLKIQIARYLVKSAAKRASMIFTPSEFTKNDVIEKFGLSPDKIMATYEGVDFQETDVEQQIDFNKPYFFYVGAAYPHKNLEFMIQAFRKFNIANKYKLVLAGKKDFFYDRLLKEVIKNDQAIKYLGKVSDEELIALYKNAYAFVFPSQIEGFGLPPLEAMSQRCPVLSSNSSCLPEILGDAALFFGPTNRQELINLFNKIAGDNNLRQELIQKGKEKVKQYSWEKLAEQTKNGYEQIIYNK